MIAARPRNGPPAAHPSALSHGHFDHAPVIEPTVAALTELAPELIAPGHCTGWRAQHTLAAMLPEAWVQTSVGTTYTL